MPNPSGAWANFTTECPTCGGEISVTNAKPEPHHCRIDLDAIAFRETRQSIQEES